MNVLMFAGTPAIQCDFYSMFYKAQWVENKEQATTTPDDGAASMQVLDLSQDKHQSAETAQSDREMQDELLSREIDRSDGSLQ